MLNPCTSAIGTKPSPMWQTYETSNKQKDHNYVWCIYHCSILCMGLSLIIIYNHEKVNFRLFNAYKKYKVIKVKDGDSAKHMTLNAGVRK